MEIKDWLKQIYIKRRTCYYIHDIMEIIDNELNNILLDKKSYKTYKNQNWFI